MPSNSWSSRTYSLFPLALALHAINSLTRLQPLFGNELISTSTHTQTHTHTHIYTLRERNIQRHKDITRSDYSGQCGRGQCRPKKIGQLRDIDLTPGQTCNNNVNVGHSCQVERSTSKFDGHRSFTRRSQKKNRFAIDCEVGHHPDCGRSHARKVAAPASRVTAGYTSRSMQILTQSARKKTTHLPTHTHTHMQRL